jgi:multidrug efflux system membrane fusion protein
MAEDTPDAPRSDHAEPAVPAGAPAIAGPTDWSASDRPLDPGRRSAQADPAHPDGAPKPAKPRRRRWIWFLAIALILLIGGCFLLRRHDAKKEAAAAAARRNAGAAITITTATAVRGNIGIYLDAIGTVTPVHTDSITSQVNGSIVAVHYQEGQLLRAGAPLIDIDARPYQAMLLQAQGTLERDENLLAQAEMDLKRYRAALARNAIAEQIEADQEKLVLQDRGIVKNDQGTVQYDELQVNYCHITSPIGGIVGLRLVDPGNLVQSTGTMTLAVVTQLQPITVIFTIPEDSLAPVRARLRADARLAVDAFDRTAQTKIASGTLAALDNQIDTTTGTVKGRAIFANRDNALFPNQFVNTRLLVNTLQGVTVLPSSAIERNGQSSFVYVIQNGTAHVRNIKAGVTDGAAMQVGGVNPGEVVADSSFDKLQDNAKVVTAGAPAKQPAAAGAPGKQPAAAAPSRSKTP